LNGVTMPLLEILSTLETLASAHGVGRSQQLAVVGGSGRAVVQRHCDAPAATLLDVALRQFERLVLPADAWRDVQSLAALYRDIVFRGAWGAASRRGCDAFVNAIHAPMTGAVRLRLFKGRVSVIDCASASAGEFVDAAR
jgi:argininosuccinate synthase